MFFHRAIGKITFPLIAIAFCLLSVQTTWQFLNAALPHESWLYKVLGLAVFELGAFCWFSLLTSGAENVLRTIIALVMTVICVGGVATAAIYEIGSQMQDLGFQMDPAFLSWTPLCVLVGMVATLIATLLYMAASPHVAHRFAHMNATGQEPPIGSYIQRLPSTQVQLQQTGQLPPVSQPLALPAPASIQQSRQGFMAGIGSFFSRLGAGLQNNGPTTYAPVQADEPDEVPVNEPVAPPNDAQENAQIPQQGPALGMIESRMLDAFLQAPVDEQATLLNMAHTQSTAAVTAYLQQRYPSYAGFITEDRVRNVMAAYMVQAGEQGSGQPEPEMHTSSASAQSQPAARRKPASKAKVAGKRSSDDLVQVLELIEKSVPDITVARLAKMAGCDESTVRRYRASKKQGRA